MLGSMLSTLAPRITNSWRGGSGAPGAAADRETVCCARASLDAATKVASAVVPVSIVRRLRRVCAMLNLPCLQNYHQHSVDTRRLTSARCRRFLMRMVLPDRAHSNGGRP